MRKRKSNATLEKQYQQQGECCYYCKRKVNFEDITRDHLYPVSKGHTLINNKVFACRLCNNTKGNKDFISFRAAMWKKACDILIEVKDNNWKITTNQINKFKYYVRVGRTVTEIIENGDKTEVVFS
jgi:5-methylcytosine-specific restriction endonuclease McrA